MQIAKKRKRSLVFSPSTFLPRIESLEARLPLTAQLVTDLNNADLGLDPTLLTVYQDEVYFTANAGDVTTAELWKTDGTTSGTQLVAELGRGEIVRLEATSEHLIAIVQRDRDFNHRTNDLYASDGTAAGTVRLADNFQNNAYHWGVSELEVVDDTAYFAAESTFIGALPTIFSTNGTVDGTHAGFTCGEGQCSPDFEFEELGGEVFLTAKNDDGSQIELLAHNPVDNSSRVVKPLDHFAHDLTAVGDLIYFTTTGASGKEVWVTDGSADGTKIVADLNAGEASANPRQLTSHAGKLYFVADDGSGLGTWAIESPDANPTRLGPATNSTDFVPHGDSLVIAVQTDTETTVWKTAGTPESTETWGNIQRDVDNLIAFDDSLLYTTNELVENLQSLQRMGPTGEITSYGTAWQPGDFATNADRVFFSAAMTEDENGMRELLFYDGDSISSADTPFRSGSIATDVNYFFEPIYENGVTNGSAIVGVAHGADRELTAIEFPGATFNVQTVITDGTDGRTNIIANRNSTGWSSAVQVGADVYTTNGFSWTRIDTSTNSATSTNEAEFTTADERYTLEPECEFCEETIFFNGVPLDQEGDPIRYAGRDYTPATTSHGDYAITGDPDGLSSSDIELIRRLADGTVEVVFQDDELASLGISFSELNPYDRTVPTRLFAVNDTLFFANDSEDVGRELWQSDGTVNGTFLSSDIHEGARGSGVELLGVSGDTLFFMADDGMNGRELWTERPFVETLVADINRDGAVDFKDFLILADQFGKAADPNAEFSADLDGCGSVKFSDFLRLTENYGRRL